VVEVEVSGNGHMSDMEESGEQDRGSQEKHG
jgi:hypothetical protein